MFGRLGATRCVGLPGNPVAALVCSHLFIRPLLAKLGGRPHQDRIVEAVLGAPMADNDQRQDFVRATVERRADRLVATPFPVQDSSMLRLLADAGGLIVRDPFAAAADAGAPCRLLLLG
jgi:molybdopterin molybdotransferase